MLVTCSKVIKYAVSLLLLVVRSDTLEGADFDEHRVIMSRFHGHPLMKGMYPFMVYIDPVDCTGTIITEDWVLSAAHCFADKSFKGSIRLYAGIVNQDDILTAQFRTAKRHDHPRYRHFNDTDPLTNNVPTSDRFYDITLLRTNRPFFLNDVIRPVKLASGPLWSRDARCRTVGFGLADGNGDNALKWIRVIAGSDRCRQFTVYEYMNDYFGPHTVCGVNVDESGKTACYADSGGPLMCDGMQVGVLIAAADHDRQDRCDFYPHCGSPSLVYAYVGFYSDWILSLAGDVKQEVNVRSLREEPPHVKDIPWIRSRSCRQCPPSFFSLVVLTCCLCYEYLYVAH